MMVLKWRNKFSNETGYVRNIQKAKGYFVNTTMLDQAKKYKSEDEVQKALAALKSIGETNNNVFETVTLQ